MFKDCRASLESLGASIIRLRSGHRELQTGFVGKEGMGMFAAVLISFLVTLGIKRFRDSYWEVVILGVVLWQLIYPYFHARPTFV